MERTPRLRRRGSRLLRRWCLVIWRGEINKKKKKKEEEEEGMIAVNDAKDGASNPILDIQKLPRQVVLAIDDQEYVADSGVIWMTGQNNPIGNPEDPENTLPYMYEQVNVLDTILKNIDRL